MKPSPRVVRYGIGAIVFVLLALLIWFGAPLIGAKDSAAHFFDPPWIRWLTIGLVAALWITVEGFLAWRVHLSSKKLAVDLSENQKNASESAEESRILEERFRSGMADLKRARFANVSGVKALYVLPWYVFIGAPGSGKTTALLQSGLRFPLAKPGQVASALAGIGGTRNCDWWFTDRAVLIDTAGRYVTHSSNAQVDHAAWRTFLGLLKRFRPRQPINGILVTLSVGDMLTASPTERAEYAQAVRLRVQELQAELGLQFPIYLLVTKCDLLSGFTQFFSEFGADLRAQVWGSTFAMDLATRKGEDPKLAFQREFPILTARINDLLFRRLHEERDSERRALMYAFPQELAAVEPLITEFLETAFADSKLQAPTLVRGVFFISGTQQGAPIDRILKSLEKSLNLRNPAPLSAAGLSGAKAFFIHRLLTEVVFPEAPLAGLNDRRERRLRRTSIGLLIASVLAALTLMGLLSASYLNNRNALQDSARGVEELRQQMSAPSPDLRQLLQTLTDLASLPDRHFPNRDSPALTMRAGLFQGDDFADAVQQRYDHALRKSLLPMLVERLESNMASAQPRDAYAALRVYIMLYEPAHMERRQFVAEASRILVRELSATHEHEAVAKHLQAMVNLRNLDAPSARIRNEAAVSRARATVAEVAPELRAYARLLEAIATSGRDIRLDEIPGASSVLERRSSSGQKLSTPLPFAFTRSGYLEAVRPQVLSVARDVVESDSWVLGRKPTSANAADIVALMVLRRYASEFTSMWGGVLNDLHVRRPNGIGEAVAVARTLSTPESPLAKLVLLADEQSRLAGAAPGSGAGAASAPPRATRDALSSGTMAERVREIEAEPEASLAEFRRLADDVRAKGESTRIFKDLAATLFQIQAAAQQGTVADDGQIRLRELKDDQAAKFAPPWSTAVADVAGVGLDEAKGAERKKTKEDLGGASAYCARVVPKKYPFVRDSGDDLGLRDFATIFQPDGDLASYFKKIADRVDTSGEVWRPRASGAGALSLKPETLQQFRNADRIRRAFFRRDVPEIAADVSVVFGDGELTLDYGGVALRLRAGGPGAQIQWPAPQPGARLSAGGHQLAQVDGPWALFRLLERGSREPGGGSSAVRVSYPAPGGGKYVVEFRAQTSDPYNPFRMTALRDFACPSE